MREWILNDQKPLVALMGDSGVGKTSLLRAGFKHYLQNDGVQIHYWEAVPTDSDAKLLNAVRADWKEIDGAPLTLEELGAAVSAQRRVVIIDQAEQLSPENHRQIFDLLQAAATTDPPYQGTWVVAFRREYLPVWRDFELGLPELNQRRLETLSLKRFLPGDAGKVVAVLAEEADISLDHNVVKELIEEIAVDGRISPVDIGISLLVLSELSERRTGSSISLSDFRGHGGQVGLLPYYLENRLEHLPEADRKEALLAMLELIDLQHDQRFAEGRPLADLERRVKPVSPIRFAASLKYLASAKARVLDDFSAEEPPRYRLLHERFIPAVRRLAGVLLAEAEQASLLLERSYRAWKLNERQRYLLSGRDLRQVLRFRKQLDWGLGPESKKNYVRLSKQRRDIRRLFTSALILVAAGSLWVGYESLEARRYRALLDTWGIPEDLYDRLENIEELTLPPNVTRVDWLRKASRLHTLTIQGVVEATEGLPPSLKKLTVMALSDLSHLPPSLISLTMGTTQTQTSLEGLPEGLKELNLTENYPVSVWRLPPSLERLSLTLLWPSLPDLSSQRQLRSLKLTVRRPSEVRLNGASLPQGLRSLYLNGIELPNLYELSRQFPHLETLGLRIEHALDLKTLPNTLRHMHVWSHDFQQVRLSNFPRLRSLRLTLLPLSHTPIGTNLEAMSLDLRELFDVDALTLDFSRFSPVELRLAARGESAFRSLSSRDWAG